MSFLFTFISLSVFGTYMIPQNEIDSSQDRINVEKAVVAWADSTFYSHTNYKFENFRAEYSDDYFIAIERSKAYKERVADLEKDKASGVYKGTQEQYDTERKTLNDAYLKVQNEADNCKNRADYYLIHFWSNIQTTDGITVYYEHIIKLNNAYQVIEANINSAIGKKDENTKPIYKKDLKGSTDVKKKVDNSATTTDSTITPTTNTGNGSVEIVIDPNDVPIEDVDTGKKTKKEKKKKTK